MMSMSELSINKSTGSNSYCIKLSNGVPLKNLKTSMKLKREERILCLVKVEEPGKFSDVDKTVELNLEATQKYITHDETEDPSTEDLKEVVFKEELFGLCS